MKKKIIQEVKRIREIIQISEGNPYLPAGVSDNDPYFNQPDNDDFNDWFFGDKKGEIIINSENGGEYNIDLSDILPDLDEDKIDMLYSEWNTLQKNPEIVKEFDKIIRSYMESNSDIDWEYPEPDFDAPDDGGGDTEWMDYINEYKTPQFYRFKK